MRWTKMRLGSWGGNSHAEMRAARPERLPDVWTALREAGRLGVIPYGAGRNYGDIAILDKGAAVLTRRLDRILELDSGFGRIAVEAGITFAELHDFVAPRGFLPPVLPGTAHATIGGGIASDVHGKSHDKHGSLGQHVEWLELVTADGSLLRVTPEGTPDLFAATIGGIGLTGVIVAVGLRLLPVRANAVEVREWRVTCLDAFLDLLFEHRSSATYTVGWIDALRQGASLGRGIFQAAEPVFLDGFNERLRPVSVPFRLPDATLNRFTVGAFNEIYYRRIPAAGRTRRIGFRTFHHPLDSVAHWNRLYGRRGFYQFQCVVPDDAARQGIRLILEAVSHARAASFLGVLKTFGGEGIGHLSFPMRGVTISLDIPAGPASRALMARLEAITLDHAGRIYLAKDATLSAEGFARMYPRLDAFRAVLRRYDPAGIFDSAAARRLRIRSAAP